MKHLIAALTLILIFTASAFAQPSRELVFTNSDPASNGCLTTRLYINRTNQTIWANVDGVCTRVGGSGGGGGGTGDVVGPSGSADSELLIASGITGKLLKRTNTMTGYVRLSSGVVSASPISADDLPSGIDATKLANGTVSNAEYQFLDGVNAAIQTQLNARAPLISPSFITPSLGAASGSSLTVSGDITAANFISTAQTYFINAGGTIFWKAGTGSPEGVVTAGAGSVWSRTDGSTNTSLYRKESGVGNTGWVAVSTGGGGGGGGDALTTSPLSQFAPTTSAQLAGVITDETGTNKLVYSNSPTIITPIGIVKGDVGLGNVDNTPDASKPVSTAQQTALDLKANLASPTFTGTPAAPTATVGTSTTQLATTAFVTTADNLKANLASPTFTGTVSIPSPFTLGGTSVTTTGAQLNFVSGVTSNIQTQLNARATTGAVTTSGLTMASARMLGRSTGSTGAIEEIIVGSGLSLSAGTLSATSGGGTVTVVGAGALTSTALVTGGGTTTLQTAAPTATMDSSGNISTPGTITTGAGSTEAGNLSLSQGTATGVAANTIQIQAPTSVTGYNIVLPGAAGDGVRIASNSSNVVTETFVGTTGSGNVARATSPVFVTPTLGVATATSVNGLTITTTTGTLTVTSGKTASISNTLTFTGTDSSSVAFGAGGSVAYNIASGTSSLGTSAISSGACATVVTSTATGTATTDTIGWGFNGDPTGVTGYAATANGMLTIIAYPSSGNVNFKVCNNTSASVTPGAITLNWRVAR
jgi:trimeric autotransporter adhesin